MSSRLLADPEEEEIDIAEGPALGKGAFHRVLPLLYLGILLASADSTILTTLLASIASDINALDSISWAATSYLVAYSALQPAFGKLSDIYGRKKLLLSSTITFAIGCQLCSMANGIKLLVAGRVLNGIGAGGMLSMASTTIADNVATEDNGIYLGISNTMFAAGASLGGVFGSAAQAHRGWRFAFSIQVPVSFISVLLIWFLMPDKKPENSVMAEDSEHAGHVIRRSSFERIDFVGSLSLATFITLLMLVATLGGTGISWSDLRLLLLIMTAALTAWLFYYWETHRALEPVLPLTLLADRTILSTCVFNFLAAGATYIFFYNAPLYLIAVRDYSPTRVARLLILQSVGGPVGSILMGIWIKKSGKIRLIAILSSSLFLFVSWMWLMMVLKPDSIAGSELWRASCFFLTGFANVSLITVSVVALLAAAPEQKAVLTAASYTFRGSGSSVFVAVASAIFNYSLLKELQKSLTNDNAAEIIEKVTKSVEAIHDIPKKYQPLIKEGYSTAIGYLFSFNFALAGLIVVGTCFIRKSVTESYAR